MASSVNLRAHVGWGSSTSKLKHAAPPSCSTQPMLPACSHTPHARAAMHPALQPRRQQQTARHAPAAAASVAIDTNSRELSGGASSIEDLAQLDHIYGIARSEWLKLKKPTRYMGNEFGAMRKPWDSATVRFSLTYPEIYEVGSSNLGHIILYTVLNQTEGLLCDRAYFPEQDLVSLLERHNKSLFAVESKQPLPNFDCLGFSLAYELGCTNILQMLKLSGIPITWEERKAASSGVWDVTNGGLPLIFAGGPTATSNPEPFADFFDFFALGDGEELLVEIGEELKRCKAEHLDRETTLFRLASNVAGVYVPQFYDAPQGFGGSVVPMREGVPPRILRRVCTPDPFQQIGLVPFVQTVHDRMTVEIRRGCTRGCRFCQPGMLTRPARDVDPDQVVEAVADGMRKTGYNEFSLLSLSCSDYLSLPSVGVQIKNRLKDEGVSLTLPSQRVDRFDDDIANIITGARKSGLTFAPEAGTQRLRDIINKGLTNEELVRGVKTAWERGWKQVKLYFMIGLPGETDEDVMGIVDTVRWLQQECRQGRWHLAVHITISNFTPKPHTPFQWHSVSTSEFARKQQLLKAAFSKLQQVKVNFTSIGISAMEDFIGRGDRRVSKVIKRAWELGAMNDSWWESESKAYAAWCQAIEDCGLTWKYRQVEEGEWNVLEALGDDRYRKQGAAGRGRLDVGALADKRLDMPLPWDHINTGISKLWLKQDLQRALEAATVPDCSHSGICSQCGVCGDEFGDNVVFEPPPIPKFEGHVKPNTFKAQRLRFRYSKGGDAIFVGHLDMMTMFERACRRAALPISMDGSPYNSRSLIYTCVPLSLGHTSSYELLEVFLNKPCKPQQVLEDLQAQLPSGLKLHSVEECEVFKLNGAVSESMFQLLHSVEYEVLVSQVVEPPTEVVEVSDDHQPAAEAALEVPIANVDLKEAVAKLHTLSEFKLDRVTKSGKLRVEDQRPLLLDVEYISHSMSSHIAEWASEALGSTVLRSAQDGVAWGVIKFRSGKKEDNNILSPQQLVSMLSSTAGCPLALLHAHRTDIEVHAPPKCELSRDQVLKVKNLAKYEGHMTLKARFGSGPWSKGLENRVYVDDFTPAKRPAALV